MKLPNKIETYMSGRKYTLDQVGLSGSRVYLFDDMVLKVQPESVESQNELQMLQWLFGKIPVPQIIEHISENNNSYILMTRCAGKMSCDEEYMNDPHKQAQMLAQVLQQLWSIYIADCPCSWPLEQRLQAAAENVAAGKVDMADAQPDTYGPGAFQGPEELLRWLIDNKPEEQQVLTHGDFCLPNVMLDKCGLSGLIDLGKAGISDPWQDIALCYRSLSNNYGGVYNGRSYPGFKNEMLFDALGIKPDWDLIRYYILLDELF